MVRPESRSTHPEEVSGFRWLVAAVGSSLEKISCVVGLLRSRGVKVVVLCFVLAVPESATGALVKKTLAN